MREIRVLIADDHALVRMGLVSLLGTQPDIKVIGEADDGESAVRKACENRPDVVIMDFLMPKMTGDVATAEIRRLLPDAKILLLTSYAAAEGIGIALRNGASGVLLKNNDYDELIPAIRRVAAGETIIAPEVVLTMKKDPPIPQLTDRQLEILELITHGFSNSNIASALLIREDSVKKHTNAIFTKLGAANRAEAVAIALRKHLLKI